MKLFGTFMDQYSTKGLVLAIAFSAYTKPGNLLSSAQFKYLGTFGQTSIQTLSNWSYDNTTLSCAGDNTKACTIVVDEQYYHLDEEGTPTLNDEAFIATDRTGTVDASDSKMIIIAEQGNVTNLFKVSSAVSGTTATTIDNQQNN